MSRVVAVIPPGVDPAPDSGRDLGRPPSPRRRTKPSAVLPTTPAVRNLPPAHPPPHIDGRAFTQGREQGVAGMPASPVGCSGCELLVVSTEHAAAATAHGSLARSTVPPIWLMLTWYIRQFQTSSRFSGPSPGQSLVRWLTRLPGRPIRRTRRAVDRRPLLQIAGCF